MLFLGVIGGCGLGVAAWGQEVAPGKLEWEARWGEERLELGVPYRLGQDTVVWEEVRLYVQGCHWGEGEATGGAVHLYDAAEPEKGRVPCPGKPGSGGVAFLLGVDSATSVAGVMPGDLDPVHGMYWTWQSGYIFMKLEGRCTRSAERDGRFYWHVGGFEGKHAAQRWVKLPVEEHGTRAEAQWVVAMDLRVMAEAVDWTTCRRVMSPGEKAAALADAGQRMFTLESRVP
jgi:hypothetical protein